MDISYGFHTVAAAGWVAMLPAYPHYILAARFDTYRLADAINHAALLDTLLDKFGDGCCLSFETAARSQTYLLLNPAHDLTSMIAVVCDAAAVIDQGGCLDEDNYATQLEQTCFALWHDMSTGDRMALLLEHGVRPTAAFNDVPPEELQSELIAITEANDP